MLSCYMEQEGKMSDLIKKRSLQERLIIAKTLLDGVIKDLPSAQPEVIRCKDCKWWTKQKDSLQGRCALFGMYPTGEWYCANAKMEVENE